jgi:tetratricopeptide (TPR) repeat protein
MLADDLCLLGIALARSGNRQGALDVWEQARVANANHAETLFELTRAYYLADRLTDAAEIGRQLASHPGWEARANALLGLIQFTRNDPMGAAGYWRKARDYETAGQGRAITPIVSAKALARALLQTQRPGEARHLLRSMLDAGPDPEAFWLLSRAHLQEGATAAALDAWEKGKMFREENPLLADPAPYIGSAACARCHPANYQAQQSSRHARTFFRVDELDASIVPAAPISDSAQPKVTHVLQRINPSCLQQETHADGRTLRAVVEYAFGSGDRGLSLVGRDENGHARELRLSRYRHGAESFWDVTSGHPAHPSEVEGYLGRALTEDGIRRCLLCHVTDPQAVLTASGPGIPDRAIGCEKCHGPGGNHLAAVAVDFPDLAIARPTTTSGSAIVGLCAQCHSPRGTSVSPDDPGSVRFQGTTLTWSRCFTESNDRLDCVTCHDPHRDAATSPAHYEAKCRSCHTKAPESDITTTGTPHPGLSERSAGTTCPVNPTHGCIGCHMPTINNVFSHSSFTDHFIRVHRG